MGPTKTLEIGLLIRPQYADVLSKAKKDADALGFSVADAGESANRALGPYTRLEDAVRRLRDESGSLSGNQMRDLILRAERAQGQIARIENPPQPGGRPIGPYSRLEDTERKIAEAQSSNTLPESHLRDLMLRAERHRAQIAKIEAPIPPPVLPKPEPPKPGMIQKAGTGFLKGVSQGGGIGGGIAGAAMALGPEAELVVLAAQAVQEVADAAIDFAKEAIETAREFNAARASLIATRKETAQVIGLGGAGGFDAAAAAASLQERLASDPIAAMRGRQLGLDMRPNMLGDKDLATNLVAAIRSLRALPEQQRAVTAKNLGLTQTDPLLKVSNETFDKVTGADAEATASAQSAEHAKKAAEFMVSMNRAAQARDNLWAVLSDPAMEDLTDFFNKTADILNAMAKWAADHKSVVDLAWKAAKTALFPAALVTDIGKQGKAPENPMDSHTAAVRENTRENRNLTEAVNRLRGTYGGGDRARGAIPGYRPGEGEFIRMQIDGGWMRARTL